MKLRTKVVVLVAFIWFLFILVVYFGSNIFLMTSFKTLEKRRLMVDIERVQEAFHAQGENVKKTAVEYSKWTDAYDFVRGKKPEFARENITLQALGNTNVNLMTYWDKQGRYIDGVCADEVGQRVACPQGLSASLKADSIFNNMSDSKDAKSGLAEINGQVYALAMSNITNNNQSKASAGMVIFGRKLSSEALIEMMKSTKIKFKLVSPETVLKNALNKEENGKPQGSSLSSFNELNRQIITTTFLIRGLADKPVVAVELERPRDIVNTGRVALYYFMQSFVWLGVSFLIIIIYTFRKVIVSRLERLAAELYEITSRMQIKRRVSVVGSDELSYVSSEINQMLSVIDAAHDKLESQVEERTRALSDEIVIRKGVEKELLTHKQYLQKLAHYDGLTGLPNRFLFNEYLNESIANAKDKNNKIAVLFLDMDKFKRVNDTLGHRVGDALLKEVSSRLSKVVTHPDLCARIGGDEFMFLIKEGNDLNKLNEKIDHYLEICREPIHVLGNEFHMTASVGISLYPDHGKTLEDLQMKADIAMYQAKSEGGNKHRLFIAEMYHQVNKSIQFESALRRALDKNEFVVYFQPKLSIREKKIRAVEALVRWHSPTLGLITPDQFIEVAEESGLILNLGEFVLREACRINKQWQQDGYEPVIVAVNVSVKQFLHQDIVGIVHDILTAVNLDPAYLEIEVTETAIMENIQTVTKKLNDLAAMGVKIAIDDFGTGSTTIKHLKDFPIDVLKIDQSFISGIPHQQSDVFITNAIISLAHNLGVLVVAEGVENSEQLEFLAEHHCDMVQGYLIGRPVQDFKLVDMLTMQEEAVNVDEAPDDLT